MLSGAPHCSFEKPLDDGGGFEKGNDAMHNKFKGKGAPLVQAAAVVAVAALFGSEVAMAGADTTFNTALSSFTGFLEGSGGKIITVLSLAGGIVGWVSDDCSLSNPRKDCFTRSRSWAGISRSAIRLLTSPRFSNS